MLEDITADDGNLYYGSSYTIDKQGNPLYIESVYQSGARDKLRCRVLYPGADGKFSVKKNIDLAQLILEIPKLGYINIPDDKRADMFKRTCPRSSRRLLNSETVSNSISYRGGFHPSPALVAELFRPTYKKPMEAIELICSGQRLSVALNPKYQFKYSYKLDTIFLECMELQIGYVKVENYKEQNKKFSIILFPKMEDYKEEITEVFRGELDVDW